MKKYVTNQAETDRVMSDDQKTPRWEVTSAGAQGEGSQAGKIKPPRLCNVWFETLDTSPDSESFEDSLAGAGAAEDVMNHESKAKNKSCSDERVLK